MGHLILPLGCWGLLPLVPRTDLYRGAGASNGNHGGKEMRGLHIKPLGWIALAVLIGLAIYFLVKWRGLPSGEAGDSTQER